MAHSNVFSEIEKSLNRNVSKEEFFHGVWSNENSSKPTSKKEFNNSNSSECDDKISTTDNLDFQNEVGNFPENETLPKNPNHERDKDVPQTVDGVRSGTQSKVSESRSHSATDSVDYFDSEDEFFETYRNKFEEYQSMVNFGVDFRKADNKDRYCQGVSQYYNMPVFMKSLQKFADDNNFEIHDVKADGNCLFRAIADQLVINGIFGNTSISLRENTLIYLRQNPCQEDGSHIDSFLFNENWEQYLMRMENPTEWCDHIVLKAAVDALVLRTIVFNVYGNDVRRTEILPANCRNSSNMMTIYLGHLGEFHYLSLRPNTWESQWQKKALLFRYMVCSKDMDSDSRSELLRSKIDRFGLAKFVEHNSSMLGIESNYKMPSKVQEYTFGIIKHGYAICPNNALPFLEPEECEDSRQRLKEDPFYIDKRSGIPLLCLSFLTIHLVPMRFILTHSYAYKDTEVDGTLFRYLGTNSSGTDVFLKDIMPMLFAQKQNERDEVYGATVVALTSDVSQSSLIQDTEMTYPGYLRLKVSPSSTDFLSKDLYRYEGYTFLKKMDVPSQLTMPPHTKKCLIGFKCKEFPTIAEEWKNRRRIQWPSNAVVTMVQNSGCAIIPKHHPSSRRPGIEWKYDFSVSEAILFQNVFSTQRGHGFYVIKILLDHCTASLSRRLKNKHIRAAFFNSCELIPNKMWYTNIGGCILYVFSYLTTCLQNKNLPNYFIPKRNMLFGFSDEEINAIYVQVEALRLFPHQVMVHIAEMNGFRYAANLTTSILQDCKRFASTSELGSAYQDTLMPETIKTVKFLTRRGFYEQAAWLFFYMFDCQHLYGNTQSNTNFPFYSAAEFYCNALGNINHEISRVMVAMHYETIFGERIVDLLCNKEDIFLKDILPLETNPNIAWLRVPEDKIGSYELLAEFLYEFGEKELKRLNSKLAESAISEAIQCLERAIKDKPEMDVSEIEDEMLKMEIRSQRADILRQLKEKLEDCYIHMYFISNIRRSYDPLQNYMHAIEELCKDLPEMSGIVSEMYAFLKIPNKRKEYADLYEMFIGTGTRSLAKTPSYRHW